MFSLLSPYKWLIYAGLAIVLSLGAWRYTVKQQDIGYQRAVSQYTAKQLENEKIARAKETALNQQLEEARNAATIRDQKITALSGTLESTTSKLRDTITGLRKQLNNDSLLAARRKADTSLALLGECTREYRQMAEDADRHASDVKLLQEAWPK